MYLCLSLKTKGCGKAWGVSHCRTGPCCLYFCAWAGWAGSCPALLQTLACLWKSAEPKGNSNQHENVKAPQWRDECLHKNRTDWHAASDAGNMTPQMCLVIKLQLQFFFFTEKAILFLHTKILYDSYVSATSGCQAPKDTNKGPYDSYTPFQVWSHTFALCDKQTDIKVLHWTPPLHQISFPHEYEHESRSGFNIKCHWKIKWFSFFRQHSMFKYAVEKLYCDSTVNLATQVSVKLWRSRRSNSPFWIWTSVPISTTSCQNYIVHRFYSSFLLHICCLQCFMGFFLTFIDRN